MARYASATGIILTKKDLLKNDKLIVVFSKELGKMRLIAKGITSITSRRLPHLESGNYVKFSYYKKNTSYFLQETELMYGYSRIKDASEKLPAFYKALFILYQLLPEEQPEPILFADTQNYLKTLNNKPTFSEEDLKQFITQILLDGGYMSEDKKNEPHFNPIAFTEELIGKRIHIPSY